MITQLRLPAVPLVTHDPYFNVWSNKDHLYDGPTVHWTYDEETGNGIHGMVGLIRINGKVYRFLGDDNNLNDLPNLEQKELKIQPLTTVYSFEGEGIKLKVEFLSPLFLDDLEILSRPVSYLTFSVERLDQKEKDIEIYFDVTSEWAVHEHSQEVTWGKSELDKGEIDLHVGTVKQNILGKSGDDDRIDWGNLHLINPNKESSRSVIRGSKVRKEWSKSNILPNVEDSNRPRTLEENIPVLATTLRFNSVGKAKQSQHILLAYNDELSVEYFNKRLPAYWKSLGDSFEEMIQKALNEIEGVREKAAKINERVLKEAEIVGGKKYRDLVSVAYRQSIAAHKLVKDNSDGILFLSKENNSNGCMATVDVSYPSMPLYLLENPDLVKGMMTPIMTFAKSDDWPFNFAPHDIGTYPLGNKQVYGENKLENQMPIEESGNLLIMATAYTLAKGETTFVEEHWNLLTKWVNYLTEYGLDPGDQLCTDDFAGHLAHNTNLSIKALMGIGGYSILCKKLGHEEDAKKYSVVAKQLAKKWKESAREDTHYKLAFDQDNTWSLKYNLVWDQIFDLHLFDEEIGETEIEFYLTKLNKYGIPLDSREDYTKADWLLWITALTKDKEKRQRIIDSLWTYLNETKDRVPFCDWYDTKTGRRINFKNRSVVGGVFLLHLLDDKWKNTDS